MAQITSNDSVSVLESERPVEHRGARAPRRDALALV